MLVNNNYKKSYNKSNIKYNYKGKCLYFPKYKSAEIFSTDNLL